jgi:hypothetical protein
MKRIAAYFKRLAVRMTHSPPSAQKPILRQDCTSAARLALVNLPPAPLINTHQHNLTIEVSNILLQYLLV